MFHCRRSPIDGEFRHGQEIGFCIHNIANPPCHFIAPMANRLVLNG